jgi:hypothetical protein
MVCPVCIATAVAANAPAIAAGLAGGVAALKVAQGQRPTLNGVVCVKERQAAAQRAAAGSVSQASTGRAAAPRTPITMAAPFFMQSSWQDYETRD